MFRHSPSRSQPPARTLVVGFCLAAAGCAPVSMGPPPMAFGAGDETRVAGMAAVVAAPEGCCLAGGDVWMVSPGRSGGAWIFRLGGVFALDQWPFGHGGVGYRGVFGDPTERVTVGWLLEGGLIYGRVGLPIAVRWDSGVVFSTQPAIDLSVFGTLHLPAQVSFPLGEHVGLNVEGGVHAGSVGSGYFETASFTPYLVLGLQHRR